MDARGPDAPTVLLYAHHDVQPPGYVERWTARSVRAAERDGRLYGRGTADDKAGAVAHAAAVRAWLRTAGALPCNVKVLVEGEEEIGSPDARTVPRPRTSTSCAADVLLLADAGNWSVGTPGLTYSLRGLAGGDVELRALDGPVHSGMAGGAVPDPVLALARLLASLVDEHGDARRSTAAGTTYAPPDASRARPTRRAPDDDAERFARARGAARPASSSPAIPRVPLLRAPVAAAGVTVIGIDGHPIAGSSNQIVADAAARISVRRRAAARTRTGSTRRCARTSNARVPWGLELDVHARSKARPRGDCDPTGPAFDATEPRAARRLRRRPGATWASAARSRSSARSPTRSAASPRCCSAPPIPAAASTARTRASTSATGAS